MFSRISTDHTSNPASDLATISDSTQSSSICRSAMGGPCDDHASNANDEVRKVHFFTAIPGLEHIEIDPSNVPKCGPLRARPWRPQTLQQLHGTNMEWVGLLMGQPNMVLKPGKC